MSYIERAIKKEFLTKLQPNKVIVLMGARRVGKTSFINNYLKSLPENSYIKLNGDDVRDVELLKNRTVAHYKRLLSNVDLLVIDEAQNIPDIGQCLKLIVDEMPGIRVIASGSSVFDINHQIGEPLVGRKHSLHLHPLSQLEFSASETFKDTQNKLEERILFGGYPELHHLPEWLEKQDYLYEIVSSYLYKDILIFDGIRNAEKIIELLRLVAFQIGHEVSLSELANNLNISQSTVERYLDLLSKVFVVFKIKGYSKNLRKEIVKSSRWYFFDNGILNAILNNFNKLSFRKDTGTLWENYLVSERIKYLGYNQIRSNQYFWRTYDQQEIDWVEEKGDQVAGYEIKWNESKKVKIPTAWAKNYPDATFNVISKNNYLEWIVGG